MRAMAENEKIDVMLDLYRILLDWLKRQASQVLILSFGLVMIWKVGTAQIEKLEGKIALVEGRNDALEMEVRKCDAERAALQVEVRALQFQLQLAFPKLRIGGK